VNDLATHDIDLTAWITGEQYSSVSARTAHRSGRKHEDLVTVIGSLQTGIITNHLVNWLSPLKERVTILTGENGVFVANTLTADLTFYANGSATSNWSEIEHLRGVSEGDVIRYAISKKEPLLTEHENFRDAVLGKSSDIVSMQQGLANILVAEAIIKSSESGKTIEIVY
jgi:predicted dehydrogenase